MVTSLTRRALMGSALAAPAALAATHGAHAALPAVDMEAVVLAAQWDPVKADTAVTPGAGASVRLVEQALRAKGLLAASYVDGHFGTRTVSAYAAYQRSLGYSGLAANGLPGRTSLTRLGEGRFTVRRVITPGARTTHQGYPVNARTLAMLRAAEEVWGRRYTLTQGSYSPGADPTSAGTHDGGGTLDLDAEGMSTARRTAAVRALRQVGFAAWLRDLSQDDWPWHIHAVAVNDTDLASPAQRQVGAYYEGRNGLRGNGPDDGPRVPKVTYEQYLRSANI